MQDTPGDFCSGAAEIQAEAMNGTEVLWVKNCSEDYQFEISAEVLQEKDTQTAGVGGAKNKTVFRWLNSSKS